MQTNRPNGNNRWLVTSVEARRSLGRLVTWAYRKPLSWNAEKTESNQGRKIAF
jgi:hypothetical protein